MRCPYCRNPVKISKWFGNIYRWECGWCGNFGDYIVLPPERKQIFKVDLAQTWAGLQEELRAALPGLYDELAPDLGKVFLHEVTSALIRGLDPLDEEKKDELWLFLDEAEGLGCACGLTDIEEAVRQKKALYAEEALLTTKDCGTFWQAVVKTVPTDTPKRRSELDPHLEQFLWGLAYLGTYFDRAPAGKEALRAAEVRYELLRDRLAEHWLERLCRT